jgi:predicted deacylase
MPGAGMRRETMQKENRPRLTNSFIQILSGSDLSKRRLPYMVMKSAEPGPVLWLTGCMHGDEIGGTVVIHEIFRRLRRSLSRGTVHAFPLMNPMGFETVSRTIVLSKEDLNRSFPGNSTGTLAERIAQIIFSRIITTSPTLVLDLHNDWNKSIPYALLDPLFAVGANGLLGALKEFAGVTGLLLVEDTEEIRKSLSYTLLQEKVPALTLELGESLTINEKNIENGVNAIWNILMFLRMVPEQAEYFRYPAPDLATGKILRYSLHPLSATSGIIHFLKKPGQIVYSGQKIARIQNAFGKITEIITAGKDGVVLGHSDYAVTFPGSPVMAFGCF